MAWQWYEAGRRGTHWRSYYFGTILLIVPEERKMWIRFDDGEIQKRWITAYVPIDDWI